MPTSAECICCSEIAQIQEKKSVEGVQCITIHPWFETVCLSVWVLETAYYSHYGENAQQGAIHE